MESTRPSRKSRQILMWLGSAEQRLATRANRALRGAVPYAQFVVLNHLASLPGEGWTVSGLASALETGQPGVSKILRRLVHKGYVRIDTDARDRRIKRHRLTDTGRAVYREAFQRLYPQADAVFDGWEKHDVDTLHTLLYRLKADLRS